MSVTLRRLFFRLISPPAHMFWALTRTRLRGAKALLVRDVAGGAREVLLVRHTYGDRRAWNLPGGLLHRGEEPRAGALRELREELGVEPAGEARELCVRDVRVFGHLDRVHYFCWTVGRPCELIPDRAEIAEERWFSLSAPLNGLGAGVGEALALLESPAGEPGSPRGGLRGPLAADPQT